MIKVNNVWHHYGIRPILKDVSMEVKAGELVAVMGPNGMGKSTLLGVIAGVLHPVKGTVEIDGLTRRASTEDEIKIRRQVVYLPDDPYLPLSKTGREFLLAVGRLYDVDDLHMMEHIDLLLQLFDLQEQADSPIHSYSTGQKKKIGLCSALVTEAKILVLDEPFSGGLDSSALLSMSRILKSLADRKDVTVIMAVPVPELVEGLAHRIAIVADGQLIAYDTPANLLQKSEKATDLSEVLEELLHPEMFEKIDQYLGGMIE